MDPVEMIKKMMAEGDTDKLVQSLDELKGSYAVLYVLRVLKDSNKPKKEIRSLEYCLEKWFYGKN